MIAEPTDNGEARTDANRALSPRIVGKPEQWQLAAIVLLQRQAKEAQGNLTAALSSFAPEPGCSLVNGQWVKNV